MLLLNVVYQFFFAPRASHEPDLERGPQNDSVPEPNQFGGDSTASQGTSQTIHGHFSVGDDDNGTIDPIEESDEILDELEHEEYPETMTLPRKRRFTLSNALIGSSTSSLWMKLKDALDPHTSPEALEAYVPHYRHMPIFSGVIIPFSILLEIPGLTENWYIRTEDYETVDIRKNTAILDVGLGFSIAFAGLANICLVVRFMEKKIKMMTILCILFLTIHDVLNIITVTTFGVEHRFDDGFTYGQAFWMTVCSTSISTFTNITIITDLIRVPDFSNSGSGLTRKQRTLVISVMVLLTYLAFGALVQTFLDDLSFLNALYFTVVTIETVGFGDIVPRSTGARVFACFYSVFGILSLALTVGLTRETVLESIEVGYRRRAKAARQHRRTVRFEHRVVRRWNAAIEWRLRQAGLPLWVLNDHKQDHEHEILHQTRQWMRERFWPWWSKEKSRYTKYLYGHAVGHAHPRGMHLNVESLSWPQLETAAMEAGVPLFMLLPEGFRTREQHSTEAKIPSSIGGYSGSCGVTNGNTVNGKEHEEGKKKHRFRPPPIPEGSMAMPLTHARLGKMIMILGNFALAVNDESFMKVPKPDSAAAKVKRNERLLATLKVGEGDNSYMVKKQSIAEQYESLRAAMADEERKAFWVRFWLVWLIFWVFWIVGSAIFMTTEKWTFGQAMYFCFISFTTIGYGDLTPVTPAGRSVFVFWALLGIATMTILISILSEAYSSRYKSIFTSDLMTQAIKRYQQRPLNVAREKRQPSETLTLAGPDSSTTCVQPYSPLSAATLAPSVPLDVALSDLQKRVTGHLEALPAEVLKHARTFGKEAQYLIEPNALGAQDRDGVPEGLKKLMDDVAGVERLGERIQEEILKDTDARHALLAMSIENVLQKIEEIAEEAIGAVKERDRLKELQTIDASQQTGPEIEEESNIRCRHNSVKEG